MSSGIDCGKLEEVLESIFRIPIDAAKLEKWVNGGEYETVMLGDKEVPTLRNLIRQLDERTSQAAEEEINEAKKEIGALAAKIQAKIDELKAMTASAETLPPGHPATVYYNASTGEFEFGIPEGKQGIQGEPGLAPTIDIIYAGDPSEQALDIIYGGNPALDEPKDRTIIRQVNRIGTSAAWTIANPILEDGEQGFERTPEDKLLWKMGDGVTHWNDLPYPPILIDTIYRYRGSVQTVDDLPTDAKPGDVYNVIDTGANYAWTGEAWDNLGVVQEIDPAPIRDSGNPVASGGVYAALEKMQQDIAATGAPDTVTIIKNADGKLVAKNIAIGGDPTDLASARGQIGNTPSVGPHDFSTGMLAEKSGLYAAYQSGSTNGPFDGPYAELIARIGEQAGSILFSSGRIVGKRAALGAVSSTIGFGGYNRLITEEQIGDGIRATDGIISVPEYEGATATQPGTAGLVNPATPEERDYVYHGDGTWREITSAGPGKLAHAEINTYHKRDVVVTPTSFDVGELYYGDDISTTGRVFTQKVNDGIKILEDGIYNVLLELSVNNTASITGDLIFGTHLVARESGKLSSPIVMSTSSIYINTIPANMDSGSVTITKSFKAGDIIAPYLGIQQGDVFNLQWVSVVLTKFPSVVATDLGYVASLSGTVFPSVAASVQNGSAYKITPEDNLDTLKPGSYYIPDDVKPKGTLPYNDTNPNDYTIVVYGTSEQVDESYKQVVFSHTNTYKILIREVKNGKWTPWYQPITTSNPTSYGLVKLATEEQVHAGTETGAYALTPALAKLAVETFGAPRPQAGAGVGQWYIIVESKSSFTLLPGAVWVYFALGYASGGYVIATSSALAAGGTTIRLITDSPLPIVGVSGFAWRLG